MSEAFKSVYNRVINTSQGKHQVAVAVAEVRYHIFSLAAFSWHILMLYRDMLPAEQQKNNDYA